MLRSPALLTSLLLAPLLVLAAGCRSTDSGPTEVFEQTASRTVFVLAPPNEHVTGAEAELVRTALMDELRGKGYAISSAADTRLVPLVERWGAARVTLSARLEDLQHQLLWEGQATAEDRSATAPELAARVARKLLRSLPAAARTPRP